MRAPAPEADGGGTCALFCVWGQHMRVRGRLRLGQRLLRLSRTLLLACKGAMAQQCALLRAVHPVLQLGALVASVSRQRGGALGSYGAKECMAAHLAWPSRLRLLPGVGWSLLRLTSPAALPLALAAACMPVPAQAQRLSSSKSARGTAAGAEQPAHVSRASRRGCSPAAAFFRPSLQVPGAQLLLRDCCGHCCHFIPWKLCADLNMPGLRKRIQPSHTAKLSKHPSTPILLRVAPGLPGRRLIPAALRLLSARPFLVGLPLRLVVLLRRVLLGAQVLRVTPCWRVVWQLQQQAQYQPVRCTGGSCSGPETRPCESDPRACSTAMPRPPERQVRASPAALACRTADAAAGTEQAVKASLTCRLRCCSSGSRDSLVKCFLAHCSYRRWPGRSLGMPAC